MEEWLEDDSPVEQSRIEGVTLRTEGSRRLKPLQTIAASWIICDSWAGVAATVALAIVQGGPVTLTYGLITMLVLVGACVLTLGELASVYPTAGGQYHWTSILSPKRYRRVLVWSSIPSSPGVCTLTTVELRLWNSEYVRLDSHLHRDCHYPRPAHSGNRHFLLSRLQCAAMALLLDLPGPQRAGNAVQHWAPETVTLDPRCCL